MSEQFVQDEITIKISFSGGLEKLFPRLTHVLETFQERTPKRIVSDEDEILTPTELADLFKIPKTKIYQMTMRTGPGSIPRFKVGRDLRFRKSQVVAWFESQAA